MQIVLSKDSEVPLRQQITEQIVFLITTGQLCAGEELPSVRALGRLSKVHHNTVSDAYQDLVRRGWLTRRPGSRLVVGNPLDSNSAKTQDLDDLIDETIQRARKMGFPLQALRLRVRERLMAEMPDHLLVVEQEPGLREIMRQEVEQSLGWPVQGCSRDHFAHEAGLVIGAQVLVPNHFVERMRSATPPGRPPFGLVYSLATEHVATINALDKPSVISLVSISHGLLRTAKSLFAPSIGRKHVLQEVLMAAQESLGLEESDIAFCDTITFGKVRTPRKVHYRLLAKDCLADLAASLPPPIKEDMA